MKNLLTLLLLFVSIYSFSQSTSNDWSTIPKGTILKFKKTITLEANSDKKYLGTVNLHGNSFNLWIYYSSSSQTRILTPSILFHHDKAFTVYSSSYESAIHIYKDNNKIPKNRIIVSCVHKGAYGQNTMKISELEKYFTIQFPKVSKF